MRGWSQKRALRRCLLPLAAASHPFAYTPQALAAENAYARPMNKTTIWSPAFAALLCMSFLMAMGQMTASTVLPLYMRSLGAATSLVGFVSGAFAVTAILVRPFVGPAFDSFSKKRLLMAAMVLICVAMASYAVSDSVAAVVVGRFVHGAGMGCTGPLGMAMVSETLPRDRMASGIGVYTLAQASAQAIGPAFGIWLSGVVGFNATFVVTSCCMAAALVVVGVFVRDRADAPRLPYRLSLGRAFDARALPLAGVLALLTTAFACVGSFNAIYGGLRGVSSIGLYFTTYALGLLLTRPLFGRLADRLGTTALVVPGCLCFAGSFCLLSQAASLPMFLLAAAVGACGFGAVTPLLQSEVFKRVGEERRGSAANTNYLGIDVGQLAGPWLGGHAIEAFEAAGLVEVDAYAAMWLAMLAPIAAGLVLYLAVGRRRGRK